MYFRFFKRTIDLILSSFVLIVLLPFLIPICIILLFTGENEVFYLQKRVGYKNSRFQIWKFATMLKNSSKMGTGSLTIRNDPRVLPIGGFLRKTKINELPQLLNVIIGNMSLVGPRPQMEVDFFKFPEKLRDDIYNAYPGITGIGSIVFSPLAQGLLTDRYLDGKVPKSSRASKGKFLPPKQITDQYLATARALNAVAKSREQSLAQMAISWVLRQKAVTSALIGASSVKQLEQNYAAIFASPFTMDELRLIDDATKKGLGQ
jgi:hypothetical protein